MRYELKNRLDRSSQAKPKSRYRRNMIYYKVVSYPTFGKLQYLDEEFRELSYFTQRDIDEGIEECE